MYIHNDKYSKKTDMHWTYSMVMLIINVPRVIILTKISTKQTYFRQLYHGCMLFWGVQIMLHFVYHLFTCRVMFIRITQQVNCYLMSVHNFCIWDILWCIAIAFRIPQLFHRFSGIQQHSGNIIFLIKYSCHQICINVLQN